MKKLTSSFLKSRLNFPTYQPPVGGGGGGGGGKGMSSPQQASVSIYASSWLVSGVQENKAALRKTVRKSILLFLIFTVIKGHTNGCPN
ncbi:hypothetical protein ACJD0Z_04645 [Flavobacteriaceae bacterium M23B6Z8]